MAGLNFRLPTGAFDRLTWDVYLAEREQRIDHIDQRFRDFRIDRPPPSPWAEHFGLERHEPMFFEPNRTWIAPREPSAKPSRAGEPFQPTDYTAKEKLEAKDYDALFLLERLQVLRFKGLRTREAQLLAQPDTYQPPKDSDTWFQNWLKSRQIEVKENDHLPIFKKARWLDYKNPIEKTIDKVNGQTIPEEQGWSVDYQALWKELALCVELADRILKHSCKGPWMQALLSRPDLFQCSDQRLGDGRIRRIHTFRQRQTPIFVPNEPFVLPSDEEGHETDDDPKSLTSFDRKAQINRVERESRTAQPKTGDEKGGPQQEEASEPKSTTPGYMFSPDSREDYAQCFITLAEVAKGVYWTFFDRRGDPRPDEVNRAGLHYTKGLYGPESVFCTISLNVECILPLLDENSSPMERILAIHMTAISMIRGILEAVQIWYEKQGGYVNLTYENEHVVDLPSSFENAVFGGKIEFPFLHDPSERPRKGNSLIMTGSDFPTMGNFGVRWFPNFDDGTMYHTFDHDQEEARFRKTWLSYAIPGSWSVTLLTSDFWDREVPKFNQGALNFPKNFRAREHRLDDKLGSHHFETRTYSAIYRGSFRKNDAMDKLNQLLVADRNKISALRPWYWDAYYRWQVTPYSMPISRWYLQQVHRWSFNMTEWNEYQIQEMARFWLFRAPVFNRAPLEWFYSAVADLVAASLPLRKGKKVKGLAKTKEDPAFTSLAGSNASNPVQVEGAVNVLSHGFTRRRSFELYGRDVAFRREHFVRAWNKFDFYFQNRPHHSGLKNTFMAILRQMWDMIDDPNHAHSQWRFVLPAYLDELVGTNWEHPDTRKEIRKEKGRTDDFMQIGNVNIRPSLLTQFAASVADADEKRMADLPYTLRLTQFEGRVDESRRERKGVVRAGQASRARAFDSLPDFQHFTLGEIADHAKADDLWVIDTVNDQLVVYDISESCKRLKMTMEEVSNFVERSTYGFHVKDGIPFHFPIKITDKVGYVLQWMHEEDVAENDGQDGRPLWITIGLDVFNITNYSFDGDRELEKVLKSNPGGNPTPAIFDKIKLRSRFPAIIASLMPWRCGRLHELMSPAVSDLCLTVDDVAWHEFAGTGMYTIINGDVYDVTDFAAFHPGGARIMAEYAGQDASEAYLKSHGDDSARILKEHQHLRIGHIVTTRQPSEPPALDELIYDSLVYKLPETLSPGRKKAFGGKVIEEIMLKVERAYEGNRSQSLQSLWEHNDLCIELTQAKNCVARMKTDRKIRTIDSRELKACDGSEGEEWYNEGWAAINGDVYNLTSVVRHGPPGLAKSLRRYLGGEIEDSTLAALIKERYPFRIVAKLTDRHIFDTMVGLNSGKLNDGTMVLNKPKTEASYTALNASLRDEARSATRQSLRVHTSSDNVSANSHRTLKRKRPRSASPPARSKQLRSLARLSSPQRAALINRQTTALYQDAECRGRHPPEDTELTLDWIKDGALNLPADPYGRDENEENLNRRGREESARMGVEVWRSGETARVPTGTQKGLFR